MKTAAKTPKAPQIKVSFGKHNFVFREGDDAYPTLYDACDFQVRCKELFRFLLGPALKKAATRRTRKATKRLSNRKPARQQRRRAA
jgi:hypothetical protein